MGFGDLLKGSGQEGKEKHVPFIEVKDCTECSEAVVNVVVGKETPHPNTVEHHIAWIQLYGVKDSGQLVHLGTVSLTPVDTGNCAHFCVSIGGLTRLIALEYCNLHGVWENSLDL